MTDRFRTFRLTVDIPLAVQATGPLLIKGPDTFDPSRPDASFVRYPTELGDVPFLPGSSLKGVLRSGTEAMLRALGRSACDPHDRNSPCRNKSAERCEACLLFGATTGASVVIVEDGMPWRPDDPPARREATLKLLNQRTTVRQGVAIDRKTGAARSNLLFDFEALVGARFYPTVRLRNPEPDQAGLIAAAILLLDDGVFRLGSGTTRGLGRVRALPEAIVLRAANAQDRTAGRLIADALFTGPVPDGFLLRWNAGSDVAADVLKGWAAIVRRGA
ncbi:MAG: hypothetical protein C4344_04900 [Acidimicrobiia bacterium]